VRQQPGARSRRGRARVRAVAAAFAVATSLVAQAGVPAAQAGLRAACVQRDGAWTRLARPAFSAGPRLLTEYAVTSDGETVYATNGAVVVRTDDLGCSWHEVYAVDLTAPDPRSIERIATSPGRDTRVLYVATRESEPAVAVSVSRDRGDHWQRGGEVPGEAVALAAGGDDPNVVYALTRGPGPESTLVVNAAAESVRLLARSADGGATWNVTHATGPSVTGVVTSFDVTTTPRIKGLAVDPNDADRVWTYGPDGLFASTDGGATLTAVQPETTGSGVTFANAGRTAANVTQLAFGFAAMPLVGYTRPGAKKPDDFAVQPVEAPLTSLATGRGPGEFFATTTTSRVWHHPPGADAAAPLVDITPAAGRPADLTVAGTVTAPRLFGRAPDTVAFWVQPPPVRPPAPPPPTTKPDQGATLTLDPAAVRADGTPTITPDNVRIGLTRGQRRTLPYTLALPGSRKVDVYFLIDLSDSMADKIRGLKLALDRIVNDLRRAGVDPWFGVGAYRSYAEGPAYARVRDVAPADRGLLEALSSLVAAGGGTETTLAALYQTATGAGQPDANAFIAAGQQAHFRPDALRIVVNVTDEGFAEGAPQPTFAQAGAALRAVRALQVGIAYESKNVTDGLLDPPTYTPNPSIGQARMARLTGAFAPAQGADCNGDRVSDLLPGAPLVCVVDPARAADASAVAPALVNMVLAVPDVTPVSVTWAAKKPVIAGVTPRVAPAVNLRNAARLTFQVTYTCPASLPAGVYPAVLTARVRTVEVARARALVDCSSPPPLPPAIAPAVGLGVAAPPAPPVEPVSNAQPQGQPQPQPQSQPQSQAQAQGQAGMAYQEQESPQFAFAYSNVTAEGDKVLSFSRYQSRPSNGGEGVPFTVPVAVVATAAAASFARLRRRPQRATVRTRH
jgi:hypothetical protein